MALLVDMGTDGRNRKRRRSDYSDVDHRARCGGREWARCFALDYEQILADVDDDAKHTLTSPLRGGRRAEGDPGGGMANEYARMLRQHTTDAECILWAGLRDLKQIGLHFRRQAPFGRYIADFCCHSAKIIVELDGEQHSADTAVAYDAARTAYLNSRGYRVLRFANCEVVKERSRVLDAILHATAAPHPTVSATLRRSTSPRGGG